MQHALISSMNITETPLACSFFSQSNVNYLQSCMQQAALQATGMRVGRQSQEQLMTIMRAMYGTWACNLPDDVAGQVATLNGKVLDECVPQVVSGLQGYLGYLKDASTLLEPLPLAQNVSIKGTRSLQFQPGI